MVEGEEKVTLVSFSWTLVAVMTSFLGSQRKLKLDFESEDETPGEKLGDFKKARLRSEQDMGFSKQVCGDCNEMASIDG